MKRINTVFERATESALERVIEPLASYICAADQPGTVLRSAVQVLFREVEKTIRAANAHFAAFSEN